MANRANAVQFFSDFCLSQLLNTFVSSAGPWRGAKVLQKVNSMHLTSNTLPTSFCGSCDESDDKKTAKTSLCVPLSPTWLSWFRVYFKERKEEKKKPRVVFTWKKRRSLRCLSWPTCKASGFGLRVRRCVRINWSSTAEVTIKTFGCFHLSSADTVGGKLDEIGWGWGAGAETKSVQYTARQFLINRWFGVHMRQRSKLHVWMCQSKV